MSSARREAPLVVGEKVIIDRFGKLIVERRFRDSDGRERDFLLWGGKTIPAIVLAVTADGKVIALRIFRRAANEVLIEIPGGNAAVGEEIEDCVCRELLEETGYAPEKIIQLGPTIWFDPATCFTPFAPFLALGCQKIREQSLLESEKQETMEIVLVELREWISMIHRGEIRDSKTIAITFLAFPYLKLRYLPYFKEGGIE